MAGKEINSTGWVAVYWLISQSVSGSTSESSSAGEEETWSHLQRPHPPLLQVIEYQVASDAVFI